MADFPLGIPIGPPHSLSGPPPSTALANSDFWSTPHFALHPPFNPALLPQGLLPHYKLPNFHTLLTQYMGLSNLNGIFGSGYVHNLAMPPVPNAVNTVNTINTAIASSSANSPPPVCDSSSPPRDNSPVMSRTGNLPLPASTLAQRTPSHLAAISNCSPKSLPDGGGSVSTASSPVSVVNNKNDD